MVKKGDGAPAAESVVESGSKAFFPHASSEFVTLLSHYYRGEMARMMSWRDRIDRTTNWAIGAVAAMLSVSLSSPTAHHGVLLFAMSVCLNAAIMLAFLGLPRRPTSQNG